MATKQPVSKKAPLKKTSPSKKTTPSKKAARPSKKTANTAAHMKSFRVYKATEDFRKVRFNRQTIYWMILLGVIIVSQLWIVHIQLQIAELTNELIMSTSAM